MIRGVGSRATGHRTWCKCAPRSASVTVAIAGLLAGCGSGGSSPASPPPPSAVTKVTLILSSTANDQLSEFDISFQGISLTNASGRTVSLLSQARSSEFIHVNGAMEPLLTATIPQGVYTAATASVGNAQFTCVTFQPTGGLAISTFNYGQTPNNDVTVTLLSPIVVSGNAMGLVLDMQVSQSASYGSCAHSGIVPYAITPAFNLSAFALSSQPAPAQKAAVTGLDGQITALDSDCVRALSLISTVRFKVMAPSRPPGLPWRICRQWTFREARC